jgi:Zn-dependent protease with chaperone function
MNFFKEQEKARVRLVKFKRLFYLTVILTSFFTALCLFHFPGLASPFRENPFGPVFYSTSQFWVIFACVIGFILIMAWVESLNLRLGGAYIASLANASEVPLVTKDVRVIRLKNVIEEMSIASGIIPPRIYIMSNEPGINAFAAGFSMHDAVIGVSQGCLDKLTRDELQGVVAHEIGHIVNGDMKLNLELMGYLFGLMGISDVGRTLMRSGRNSKKGNPAILMGLGLYATGSLGHLLGQILRLSISRGQEFAADARSVQFTRNPEGLGGALKKILAIKNKFLMRSSKSHKISHFYLFYPTTSKFFATHPPLEYRLLKIDPSFKYSNFIHKEQRELKSLLESDMGPVIASSFAAGVAISKTEDSLLELMDRALSFMRFISSNRKVEGELSNLSDSELIQEMDIILGRLRNSSASESKNLLKQLKDIIVSDKRILHQELLCYILFKETLMPNTVRPLKTYGLGETKENIRVVLSFLANISSSSTASQEESFIIGIKTIYPDRIQIISNFSSSDIIQSLEKIRHLVPLAKEKLLSASVSVIEHDMIENFEEGVFLKVLKKVLGVPVAF